MEPRRARVGFWLIAATTIALWLWFIPSFSRSGLDLRYYYAGAERILHSRSPFEAGSGYIYPPFLAQLLAAIPLERESLSFLWNVVIAACAVLTIGCGVRAAGLWGRPYAALAFALLWSEPIVWSVTLGNASLLVAGCLAFAALSFKRVPWVAGFLIGIAAAIKLVPALMLVWVFGAYLRHRERAWLLALVAGLLTLAITFMHPDTLAYLHVVRDEASRRVAHGSNFSIFSSFERLFGVQLPSVLGPLLGAAAAFALGLQTPPHPQAERAGWGIAQLIALASTPIAWSHWFVLAFWPALVAAGDVATDHAERSADPQRWRLEALLLATAFAILTRVKLFYSAGIYFTEVITPFAPLAALALIGVRLSRHTRGASRVERVRARA